MADRKQFVYVLKLVPRLYDDSNWKQSDEDIVDRHFNRLKKVYRRRNSSAGRKNP